MGCFFHKKSYICNRKGINNAAIKRIFKYRDYEKNKSDAALFGSNVWNFLRMSA